MFLILEGFLSDIVWSNQNHLLQTIFILMGSGILYFLLKRWPNLPKTAHDSIQELKINRTIDYKDVFANLLITLVILTFGAGVGPEAALLSAIISLSIWQADNLRYLYFNYEKLNQMTLTQRYKRLLNPFKYRQKYNEEIAPKTPELLRWKKLLYLVFIINGIFAFAMLLRQTDQPSFVLKLGQSHWKLDQLWIVPVLMILGLIIAWICKILYRGLKVLTKNLSLSLETRIILGAIGIIFVAYFVPDLLFSGQHSLHLLVGPWIHKSTGFLLTMALIKLLFLIWCLSLNWSGGDIFPVTFASMLIGFAIAELFPQFDTLLIVAVVATSVMSSLSSPIVSGIFLLFFFPLNLSPMILIVAAILFAKDKYLKKA